jgi:RHS repeat-associated protein
MDQNKRYLLLRTRILGQKFYEISNHLGNVLEVITDRKVAHDNTGSIDYYEADVVKYSDYYPFGMDMPGRGGMLSGGEYRYAFNGMEKVDEMQGNGNSYDFGARMYNSRLGRWMATDPYYRIFPSLSPYNYGKNNPLYYIDGDGRVIESATKEDRAQYNKSIIAVFGEGSVAATILTIETEG